MSKFKIGDKVYVYHGYRSFKAKIAKIDIKNNTLCIEKDGSCGWYHQKQCRRIVKEKEFKIGDRVRVRREGMAQFDGEIVHAVINIFGDHSWKIIYVKEDGFYGAHKQNPFHESELTKLVKKKKPAFNKKEGKKKKIYWANVVRDSCGNLVMSYELYKSEIEAKTRLLNPWWVGCGYVKTISFEVEE